MHIIYMSGCIISAPPPGCSSNICRGCSSRAPLPSSSTATRLGPSFINPSYGYCALPGRKQHGAGDGERASKRRQRPYGGRSVVNDVRSRSCSGHIRIRSTLELNRKRPKMARAIFLRLETGIFIIFKGFGSGTVL